ncbi:hypothetical protein UWK_02419 [Desulfocapsa sulfexigens DSM 10523]|uniref:Pyridoxal phosphate-dependent enzyme n=1 Tax=Desulfocapsa sulfexigens (strain DSM 10523 / SB164P1) TaxID=1167006 RepID=M1P683_DESSD|nr:hypothetical protein [Desulfocapsa sulfexigens]AGF78958.1 hypothetical protein UWK_02419 [Desulfocapsa sulfexigens DSM 10523]
METVIENRASFVLYNVILSNMLHKGIMLLPANICPIVPATLFKTNTKFEFVDINAETLLVDCDSIIRRIRNSGDVASILVNSTFGFDSDFETFFNDVKSINEDILIINDKCLNIPSVESVVTSADVVLFSTGYSKYVDFSVGGYAFTKKEVNYIRESIPYREEDHDVLVRSFESALNKNSVYGYSDSDWLDGTFLDQGKKEYFKNIVDRVEEIARHKKIINNIYRENLKTGISLGNGYNDWRYTVVVNNKEEVLNEIFKNNLFASSHYQSLVGIFGGGKGVNAEQLHCKVINLFNDFRFSEEQAYSITKIINKYAK